MAGKFGEEKLMKYRLTVWIYWSTESASDDHGAREYHQESVESIIVADTRERAIELARAEVREIQMRSTYLENLEIEANLAPVYELVWQTRFVPLRDGPAALTAIEAHFEERSFS